VEPEEEEVVVILGVALVGVGLEVEEHFEAEVQIITSEENLGLEEKPSQ